MKKIILFVGIFAIGILVAPSQSEAKTSSNSESQRSVCYNSYANGDTSIIFYCGDCSIKRVGFYSYPDTCNGGINENK